MFNIGLVGCGMIGQVHFSSFDGRKDAQIVTVCDVKKNKLENFGLTKGNLDLKVKGINLNGISRYLDIDEMIAKEKLDAVIISVPTYLHAELSIKAMRAGINVLCEKPMAISPYECEKMISAAKESDKILQIGHCIRFWPEYVKTKEIIDSGEYGRVLAASFRRLSKTPVWSEDNWMLDCKKSGGAALDLHVHDADFIQNVFGMPYGVSSCGVKGPSGDYDHVVTRYIYPDNDMVIIAEGGWLMSQTFDFEMSFNVILEDASIVYNSTRNPTFLVCPSQGEAFTPTVESEHGYSQEMSYFLSEIYGKNACRVITPEQSLNSVKLIAAEKESASLGKTVFI